MKNKLVCILLCAVMLVGCLMSTGCSIASDNTLSSDTSGTEETDAARSSITLTLWVPTDESTTEEALGLVEVAINQVTQAEFDTAIKLYAIPDGEYEETVKNRLDEIATRVEEEEQAAIKKRQEQINAAQKGETYVEETTEYVNPNMDGDFSLVVREATGYENVERTQFDIFLVRGEEDYNYYADNFLINDLNSELTGAAKVLKSYIYPDFFEAATIDGSVYAIPNNHAVGEYTYFLANKAVVDAEFRSPEEVSNLKDCWEKGFINEIAEHHPEIAKGNIVYGEYKPSYCQYWSGLGGGNGLEKTNGFSVLYSRVTADIEHKNVTFGNIFSYKNFTDTYEYYKRMKEAGYVNTSSTVPEKFGVGFITCTAEEIKQYENDYYITKFHKPEGEKSDYLQSMFAVSTHTKNLTRSMEIITLLNTDVRLRTILQYGVEGTHWKYDEENEDVIVKLDHMDESGTDLTYKMDIINTGNVYMTYPDYGVGLDHWDVAKEQNQDSYLPVTHALEYINEDSKPLFEKLDALSVSIFNRMEAMTADEFKAAVSGFEGEVNRNDAFMKLTYIPSDSDASKGRTEEKGWIPGASIANLWEEYCVALLGENFRAE